MGAARQQKLASDRREQVEKEMAERRRHFELDRTLAELSSLAAKAAQDLEWKRQEAALLDLNQKMIREAEAHDANDRMMFRTNRAERRSEGGVP